MEGDVMKQPPVLLKNIQQKDNCTFAVEWSDGKNSLYRLSELQKQCPCAGCNEKRTKTVQEDVRAVKICSLGRYALKIQFTSGCSMGIYTYAMLHQWGKNE
jgi:DUF971 family protein